jgi:DNA repair exonuclease SbcCD nuclease subunit
VLRVLHTADWHLGRRFPSFPAEAATKLMRARLETVAKIFDLATRLRVDAVLCAGDLFDDPHPDPDWWKGLGELLLARPADFPPVVLLPGNHDALIADSVWAPAHPLRKLLPKFVHVVDRDDFELPIGRDGVVYARPCRSTAGDRDNALALPDRQPGDERIRIGVVHGTTFDEPHWQSNFPIDVGAGVARGLDYLALGDTHKHRDVAADLAVPAVYPGTPEPARFDETDPGVVAVVLLPRRGRRPTVQAQTIGWWTWREVTARSVDEVRSLLELANGDRTVLRLHLHFDVTVDEEEKLEGLLKQLGGDDTKAPRIGILLVDRKNLRLVRGRPIDRSGLAPVLVSALDLLEARIDAEVDEEARAVSMRALAHLNRLLGAHR